MAPYTAPVDDIGFLLERIFNFDAVMQDLQGFEEVNAELAVTVMEEAGKFATGVLEPINRAGDEEGSTLENGVVRTPKGMADAYKTFVEAGWGGLSGDPEFGGQGLPRVLQLLLDEMMASANLSFGLFPGLTRGAAEAIAHHADDTLKQTYLSKMTSGEWTGAMALTEASAGTDLGLLSTRAEPVGDGSYKLKGTKIFISSGDHDFDGNIIHLVLARLPDAPKGVKGISLFLAPKFLVNADGSLGDRNTMSVGSLEHKMGIHAQPTCVMNYDGATAWLVGEAGRGLNAMFTMMNAERLMVGIQGLGIAEAAVQKASDYARQRLQGRSADGAHSPVPIIEHPDVRKMLLTGRSFIEAARALAVWTALQMDTADRHSGEKTRNEAGNLVALLTPVVKASFTDFGFETAVLAQQVFGGHGYIREWGMEQFVRDARITQIYEGTNGVQALDLVSRKLPLENGGVVRGLFKTMRQDMQSAAKTDAAKTIAESSLAALKQLEAVTETLFSRQSDAAFTGAAATDYQRMFALVCFGWMWAKMAKEAAGKTNDFERRKTVLADFFAHRMLPQTEALAKAIKNGALSIMALDAELF
ncbi:alkylation response protein AidB-like acyl-CoA dehydrogenase [Rhizobium sp. BIGb0125]|uniref:acyl-CoA dehydrogenase family protein n=1 Tax=Rhizobium sp. BIGb0125 TaxID=2940618 RepID=UPI00216A1989|nr:acyl-CoA dehydrogenase C-terminal domain-containing protein [Rhizobium sp. BIGb0125]MCS4243287.1 alkylation response protein AidB-like acyl-CoA dehydrogenase [Rhizobium sp. BIGb0125]